MPRLEVEQMISRTHVHGACVLTILMFVGACTTTLPDVSSRGHVSLLAPLQMAEEAEAETP